jgi:hypothetical protein
MSTITYESNVTLWTEEQTLEWKRTWDGKKESIPDELYKHIFEVQMPQISASIKRMNDKMDEIGEHREAI